VGVNVILFSPGMLLFLSYCTLYIRMIFQVTAKIGYPITGYGTESRNRAARQRIQNRVWADEDGVEHVEVA
jgi:import inner membrane translocase subunit TIM21